MLFLKNLLQKDRYFACWESYFSAAVKRNGQRAEGSDARGSTECLLAAIEEAYPSSDNARALAVGVDDGRGVLKQKEGKKPLGE